MKNHFHLFKSRAKIFSAPMKFRRDLESPEPFSSINFTKNERIFWIPGKNPMK